MRKRKKKRGSKPVIITLMKDVVTRGDPLVSITLMEEAGPQPLLLVGEGPLIMPQRVSSRVRSERHSPLPRTSGAEHGENAKKVRKSAFPML